MHTMNRARWSATRESGPGKADEGIVRRPRQVEGAHLCVSSSTQVTLRQRRRSSQQLEELRGPTVADSGESRRVGGPGPPAASRRDGVGVRPLV